MNLIPASGWMRRIQCSLGLCSIAAALSLHARDAVVVFNEVNYHPPGGGGALEWVELHNQMSVDVDLGGWQLGGGINFEFPGGTLIDAGGYLVIAGDPAALQAASSFSGALGPFTGSLANNGEEIILYDFTQSSTGRRVMDRLEYDDSFPWPVAPDGSGATLAKLDPDTGTKQTGHWAGSRFIGGTPGTVNFPPQGEISLQMARVLDAGDNWRYHGADVDLGASWAQVAHPVGGDWKEGPSALGYESRLAAEILTPLTAPGFNGPFVVTHYFETEFSVTAGNLSRIDHLRIGHLIDDGAIIYLNGTEILRYNMPAGAVDSDTTSSSGIEADWIQSTQLSANALVPGSNRISVEVHQTSFSSSDMILSLKLDLALNAQGDGDALSDIRLNEISASTEDTPFVVELKNTGPGIVSLDGARLSISGDPAREFALPAGSNIPAGGYLVLDEALFGNDLVVTDADRIFLFSPDQLRVLDAQQASNSLRGCMESPGEYTGRWLRPDVATFGTANSIVLDDSLVINEILYHAYPKPGTPDTPPTFGEKILLPIDASWRYNQNSAGGGLAPGWQLSAHSVDNINWFSGQALLGRESSALAEPIRTGFTVSQPQITYYFETEFEYTDDPAQSDLTLRHFIDDGAIFYLNGVEVERFNLSGGAVIPTTLASSGVSNAAIVETSISNSSLLNGTNRLSVEVHQISATSSDVVFGAELVNRQQLTPLIPGIPWQADPEEWIELHNRSDQVVDLAGWGLEGGVSYTFPAGSSIPVGGYLVVAENATTLAAKFPAITIAGQFSGGLSNSGEQVVLADALGNPVDEVFYRDGGKWPEIADGGGSSLELRDSDADNRYPESWAPHDSGDLSSWQTYTYRTVAESDGQGNNVYHEFLLGLLDAGELLLDDVSVIENPDSAAVEFIQNGSFQGDAVGGNANKWRCVGTHGSHGRTVVVNDPDSPGNRCLHVVATGPTGDKHNKIETTFASGEQLVAGREYEISFRAKWLSGANLVNTRLYFSYVQKTTPIDVPGTWGTPGAANSATVTNLGPAYSGMLHEPTVPDAGEPVTVLLTASDTDGIGVLTLFYSVNGGAFTSSAMTSTGNDRYRGTIPGQASGKVIQFYVRGQDFTGGISHFPAAAENSRALIQVNDNQARLAQLHNLRIIMLSSDTSLLFLNTNRMSNDRLGATVVYDEKTVHYDVGVRLKGSAFGRFNGGHFGFNIEFDPDNLFRGVHGTISVERSNPVREIFANHLLTRTGTPGFSALNDVGRLIAPSATGTCLFAMARQTSEFFEGLFGDNSDEGTLFNHELLYNPNGTTGGAEGFKINNPYNHTGGRYDLRDRGPDQEPYRWGFQIRSQRDRDDYSSIVGVNRAMSLSGQALQDAAEPHVDIDQWTRAFAAMSLIGNDDTYSRIWEHNLRYYARPTDNRLIVLPWDLDRAFNLSTSASLIGGNNVAKLLNFPQNRRRFYGHILDLVETTFNNSYASSWASHFGSVTGSSAGGYLSFVNSRASFAMSQLPASIPFTITTSGGAGFSVSATSTVLRGNGWIDVANIEVNGQPVALNWIDDTTWEITVLLSGGPNALALSAVNHQGGEVGTDAITVTNTGTTELADSTNTIISELHYHPADPSSVEINAGFIDADLFEFVEITNTGENTIDLSSVRFTDGILFGFPNGTTLAAGSRLIAVANQAAIEFRYGAATATIVGDYAGNLRNSGEHIRLEAADASPIADFTYGDDFPWPESADGPGYSMILAGGDPTIPLNWRPSTALGGNPGSSDTIAFSGTSADILSYALSSDLVVGITADAFILKFDQILAADDAEIIIEYSMDMLTWTVAPGIDLISRDNNGDGTATLSYQAPLPLGTAPFHFARVRIALR
jgi:hypothetical protein